MKLFVLSVFIASALALPFGPSFQLNDYDWSPFPSSTLLPPSIVCQMPPHLKQLSRSNSELGNALDLWQIYPDAASSDAKIGDRLESSTPLSNQPEIRQTLMKIAEQKFNACKGKVDNGERACLGPFK